MSHNKYLMSSCLTHVSRTTHAFLALHALHSYLTLTPYTHTLHSHLYTHTSSFTHTFTPTPHHSLTITPLIMFLIINLFKILNDTKIFIFLTNITYTFKYSTRTFPIKTYRFKRSFFTRFKKIF
ncbi:hypothetical protein GLOIN_2v1590118 [Rhizophagus irregularis DAOM 181602=DAOM 197198]|uniref:Uncharacterized protein n=1 Tax=Rhizophagus irregularis (strain DAOM 181602 / DAOM 197198 / MUCL 43194) TaxID=747089 RepID=A0A2P4Q5W7_RHIID|nr:hypothetical protein GLOIN_2v1590118 [Rhizophagus irregularis DAOM 181602=DAOM 197198]POG73041.1 hypothetical protein GLOIN_2v1590118 [Rhizophagus irregularis DAOM 181602=DAOM 197198]|eukprot:XP_025179907.1 hypothetical protein GLOIN_2v1590118 [Rhizophagus irregularis DAOM 181602=DAOM 197198]